MDGKTISKLPKVRLYRINGELYLAPRDWTKEQVFKCYETEEDLEVLDWQIVSFYDPVEPRSKRTFADVIQAKEFSLDDLPINLTV